ncbi:MAG: hypothetical protein ACOX8V_01450 [Thermoleophilia bacterium]|jgi:hypothetical protein
MWPYVREEAKMTYPVESQRGSESRTRITNGVSGSGGVPAVGEGLSEEQKGLIDCLQAAHRSLTLRELREVAPCAPERLRSVIDDLVARGLICELNTIIPSYVCRYPGISLYAE